MRTKLNYTTLNGIAFFICALFLVLAYIIEFGFNQAPCSLCLLQRYALWIISLIFLISLFHRSANLVTRYVYSAFILFFSLLAFGLSLRQVWIQHLPKEAIPNCTADLFRLIQFQPLINVVQTVLEGGGECHHSHFKILGLSLAEGSALFFASLIVYSILIISYLKKRRI